MDQEVRVYCAGPLFSQKQREEMEQLAGALEEAGFETFLPQRDGLELTECSDALLKMGVERNLAVSMVSRAIFALDVFQVLEGCQATVANLNGRVPDEGTVSEAAMAWATGRTVIAYKTDTYSVFGGLQNPLVSGLFEFKLARSAAEAVDALLEAVHAGDVAARQALLRREEIAHSLSLGEDIWKELRRSRSMEAVARLVASHCESAVPGVG